MTQFQPDRTVGGVRNSQRAAWGAEAAIHYARLTGVPHEELDVITGDLLADITHLAMALGEDPDEFLSEVAERAESAVAEEAREGVHEAEEGDPEEPPFLEEPWNLEDLVHHRHFIVAGRRHGDDETTVKHVEIPTRETTPWRYFVEHVLYQGTMPAAEFEALEDTPTEQWPDGAAYKIPDDWDDEEKYEEGWAYCDAVIEINGPPLDPARAETQFDSAP